MAHRAFDSFAFMSWSSAAPALTTPVCVLPLPAFACVDLQTCTASIRLGLRARMTIHPFMHSLCNNLSHDHALRPVVIPDAFAVEVLDGGDPAAEAQRDMSMCAGEFLLAYATRGTQGDQGGSHQSLQKEQDPGGARTLDRCRECGDGATGPRSGGACSSRSTDAHPAPLMPERGRQGDEGRRLVPPPAPVDGGSTRALEPPGCGGDTKGGAAGEADRANKTVGIAEAMEAMGEATELEAEEKGNWDAVVTCFFVDTAANILEYIEVIFSMLAPGGCWINLGPLMYHWADPFSELSPGAFCLPLSSMLPVVALSPATPA